MSQMPLISVGIPTYNRPEGLKIALEQVLKQTYQNLEIIISDNCSEQSQLVGQIVDEFKKRNPSIAYHRQSVNIGSLRNFNFLVRQAKGEFFLWVADDDFIEDRYIENLYENFKKNPDISISMSAYDVNDMMTVPHIKSNLTPYLKELSDGNTYQRVYKYLKQSDHFGKSRLMWGMFKTKEMQEAFQFCLDQRNDLQTNPIWAEVPAELKLLTMGDLIVGDEVLFHVNLLPSSDGRQGLGYGKRLVEILRKSSKAYRAVVDSTNLSAKEKRTLHWIITRNEMKNRMSVLIYYEIQRRFPYLARMIKKVWYMFS